MIGNIKVKIDKDYFFPSIETLTVEEFIRLCESLKNEERDNKILADLLKCNEAIIEELDLNEYRKLLLLAENLLQSPSYPMDWNISFLPLGSYPFGQFADWLMLCRKYGFDVRCIPYTIAYLRPNVGFNLRNTEYLKWANNLPACVGIYYHNKILIEYEHLNKKFANLKGEDPTDIEIKAGIEHLSKYGEYLTLHKLAGGDITKIKEVAKLSVNEVLTYLRADKDINTYITEINVLKGGKRA